MKVSKIELERAFNGLNNRLYVFRIRDNNLYIMRDDTIVKIKIHGKCKDHAAVMPYYDSWIYLLERYDKEYINLRLSNTYITLEDRRIPCKLDDKIWEDKFITNDNNVFKYLCSVESKYLTTVKGSNCIYIDEQGKISIVTYRFGIRSITNNVGYCDSYNNIKVYFRYKNTKIIDYFSQYSHLYCSDSQIKIVSGNIIIVAKTNDIELIHKKMLNKIYENLYKYREDTVLKFRCRLDILKDSFNTLVDLGLLYRVYMGVEPIETKHGDGILIYDESSYRGRIATIELYNTANYGKSIIHIEENNIKNIKSMIDSMFESGFKDYVNVSFQYNEENNNKSCSIYILDDYADISYIITIPVKSMIVNNKGIGQNKV